MAALIYLLCALTSIGCAVLLIRSYARSKNQLLFWSAVCFVCLALSNTVLVVDLIILPDTDFGGHGYRSAITLSGLLALLYGLIKETA